MTIYLKPLALGPMENFVYLVGDPQTKEAAVVDPGWDVPAILREAAEDGYRLTHVLMTHGHYDHINGVEEIVDKTGATVVAEKRELEVFVAQGIGGLVIPMSSFKKTDYNDSVRVGRLEIRVIRTPGHTPGAQCYLIKAPSGKPEALFTGDILFVGTIGRCDFPYSNPRDLYQSLSKIKALPDDVTIYPGHDYGASPTNTIGREKKTNPFLLAGTVDDFLSMVHR